MSRDRFDWQRAILASDLQPTTRHVLLTLSCRMDLNGGSCWPSTRTLASDTGLSERSICTHIETATLAGWITIARHGTGQAWRRHEYRAAIPGKALNDVQHVKGEGAEPNAEGAEPNDEKALKEVQSIKTTNKSLNSCANSFSQFWKAYPKKRSKGQAEKAWQRLKPDERLQGEILGAVQRATKSEDWTRDGGRYIPHPATWLNATGWEDELHGAAQQDDGYEFA